MQEMQETQVWSLVWEDPLEEEMATHLSILAWKITWTEEPGGAGEGYSRWRSKGSGMTEKLSTKTKQNSDWIQLNKALSNSPEPKCLILETVNDISLSGFCFQLLLSHPPFFLSYQMPWVPRTLACHALWFYVFADILSPLFVTSCQLLTWLCGRTAVYPSRLHLLSQL